MPSFLHPFCLCFVSIFKSLFWQSWMRWFSRICVLLSTFTMLYSTALATSAAFQVLKIVQNLSLSVFTEGFFMHIQKCSGKILKKFSTSINRWLHSPWSTWWALSWWKHCRRSSFMYPLSFPSPLSSHLKSCNLQISQIARDNTTDTVVAKRFEITDRRWWVVGWFSLGSRKKDGRLMMRQQY